MASEGEGGEDLHWKLRVVIMNFVVNKSTADCDFHHPPCWQWRQGRHYGKCRFSLWISLPINHAHVCFCGGTRVGAGVGILWLEEFTPEDISIIDKILTIHYSEKKCAHFCSELCIVGYGTYDMQISQTRPITTRTHVRNVTCSRRLRFWWEVIILDAYVAISSEDDTIHTLDNILSKLNSDGMVRHVLVTKDC